MDQTKPEQRRLGRLLERLQTEVAGLPAADREWARTTLQRIGALKEGLHEFFLRAQGVVICGRCGGACCERGKNHLTLVEMLAHLLQGQELPSADFSRSCPFLGADGCRLPIDRRPFNCITFICQEIEDRLSETDRKAFYALEKELRRCYEAFDRRFAGASLRGIFLRAETLGERPLLATP